VRSEAAKVNVRDRVTQAFTEWHVDLYRFALSMGLGPPEAQEVTQDAFLRFYVALDRGESIENQKAWLFRVTHNLAINVGVKERWIGPWTPDLEDRFVDPHSNPEQAFLERERFQRLHQAVDALSGQQRQCLHLRAAGFRYREIAEIIGIRTSTVSEFLKRAIERLRKARHE
jgi:RNA polymerase sigma-70 factor (ECF subfamily)